ncbi:MAG: NAD(P)/FAD-dependent oxidoreductase [Flavobacteriales bacterium]
MERRHFIKTGSVALLAAGMTRLNTERMSTIKHDAIIIGGSFSGLSAALALARARMQVLVIDTNEPCNARVPHAHNLLTQDGEPPQAIRAKARADVVRYATVRWHESRAIQASGSNGAFVVRTADGMAHHGRKLLLALGVRDAMLDIPGFAACWGISAAACPFCHGYEVADAALGILGNSPEVVDYARLIRQWSRRITVLTNGPAMFTEEQRALLAPLSIALEEAPVARVEHADGRITSVVLHDDRRIALTALFARPTTSVPVAFAEGLGCAVTAAGLLQVDPMQRTTVPGVFASGDCAMPMRSLSMAIASGTVAGAAIVHELVLADP